MWPFKKKELKVPLPDEGLDADLVKLKQRIEASDKYEESIKKIPAGSKSFSAVENAGTINKLKDRVFPERTFLINMELRNGMHKTFMISTKKNYFKFMEGTYIIDQQMQYFNVDAKAYCLDYHADLPVPIKREVPVKEIQKTLKELSKIDSEQLVTAMNPYSLEAFIEGRVIKQLMEAQSLDDFFKRESIKSWVIIAITTLTLLVLIKASGILSDIKVPGLG